MPARIKRERTPGWRLANATTNPLGARIVDRTSRFGNPFVIGTDADTAEHATALFREWLETNSLTVYNPYAGGDYLDRMNARRDWILAHVDELAGKDLACYCDLPEAGRPDPCHAAFLIAHANARLLTGQLGTKLADSLTPGGQNTAVDAYLLIRSLDGPHVARAWMIGLNPHLDDQAPILAIQAGRSREVLAAARAHQEGVYA